MLRKYLKQTNFYSWIFLIKENEVFLKAFLLYISTIKYSYSYSRKKLHLSDVLFGLYNNENKGHYQDTTPNPKNGIASTKNCVSNSVLKTHFFGNETLCVFAISHCVAIKSLLDLFQHQRQFQKTWQEKKHNINREFPLGQFQTRPCEFSEANRWTILRNSFFVLLSFRTPVLLDWRHF